MAVLICPECGAENTPGDEYCWSCRRALTDVEPVNDAVQDEPLGGHLDELLNSEEDLPGLLHALRQDGNIDGEQGDAEDVQSGEFHDSLGQASSGQSGREEEIPEWLRRIRQRAKQEKDSIGEVTQKISAAQESLADEKRSSQHESYADWIERLHQDFSQEQVAKDSAEGAPTGKAGQLPQTEDPEWLAKILKVHGKSVEKQDLDSLSTERLGGNSLLQWLVDLESGKEKLEPLSEEEPPAAKQSGDAVGEGDQNERTVDGDTTQEIRIKKGTSVKPVLSISRKEQLEADLISATIVDETAPRAMRKFEKPGSPWVIRAAVTVILITALSLSLFSGASTSNLSGSLKPQHRALITWLEQLPAESRLLLVVDYHAGFEAEMALIAQPVLSKAVQASSEFVILSSTESGVLLVDRLLQDIDGFETLVVSNAGYFPASNFAAFGLGAGIDPSWRFVHAPDAVNGLPQGDFEGILVLSDSYDGAKTWIEQLYAQFSEVTINLITTAQAGPLLLPYYESHQLGGLVSGLSEARQMTAYLNVENSTSHLWEAYRTGVLMMIIVIVLGLFFMSDHEGQETDRSKGEKA